MLIFSFIASPISSCLFQFSTAFSSSAPMWNWWGKKSSIPPPPPPHQHTGQKTSAKDNSHLLPLSLHLAVNRGDFRLCSGQTATLHLICKTF